VPTTLRKILRMARRELHEELLLEVPAAPTVTPQGTPGTATYEYVVTAVAVAIESDGSPIGATTTGAATLTGSNFNRLAWTAVAGAYGYKVYRITGGPTQGLIATIASGSTVTVDDTGLAASAVTPPHINSWSDAELLDLGNRGVRDLWRRINNVYQDHFHTVDVTNVSLAAGATKLTGVPTDVFTVRKIMPRDLTAHRTQFKPRAYDSWEFEDALARGTVGVDDVDVFYYAVVKAGAPVGAPDILVAPKPGGAVDLTLVYVPTVVDVGTDDTNPIPGESDLALTAYIVAFGRAKEREDRMPDPAWLKVYEAEAEKIVVALDPRQTQEPDVVEGMFEGG